jgi:hypothetical protein
MPRTNICDKVVTIPQYRNTGWLNAILMCILYSQNSRKLLLHRNKLPNQNSLAPILNDILSKQYIQNKKTAEYFNNAKIDEILASLGFPANSNLYDYVISKGWSSYWFLPRIIDALNKTSISLECTKENIFVGMNEITGYNINNGELEINFNRLNDAYFSQLNTKINHTANPDYIFVHPIKHNTMYTDFISRYIAHPHYNAQFNLNTYTTNYDGILQQKVNIMYRGDEYILDSCILLNYNADKIGRSYPIAGITCKNDRYVYNGLSPKTTNKELAPPCKLFKFDWTTNTDEFSIDTATCELKLSQNKNSSEPCFTFTKGGLVLIYLKKRSVQTLFSVDKNASSSHERDKLSDNKRRLYNGKKDLHTIEVNSINQKLGKLVAKLDDLEAKKKKLEEKRRKLTDKIAEIDKKLA